MTSIARRSNDTQQPAPLILGFRRDTLVIVMGIVFSFVFTALIYAAAPRLEAFPKLPDEGPAWYYWKLAEPTLASRLSVWGMYLAHQFAFWGLIWYAQNRVKKYAKGGGLHPLNWIALAINALFIVLHFVQTHVWYDGLAQDVSIFSSQGSVIVMLVVILMMENRRRGMFFGKPLPLGRRVVDFVRHYHGYFFAWAITYTFWYHPMEATNGHLLGFFYTFLLLLQGSLFLTRIHVNKWWMFVQEITVLAHGTIVAIVQGNNMWPMFFFGFAGIFVITQMHGLGLKNWVRWLLLGAYVAGAAFIYSQPTWEGKLWQLAAIPAIDYLAVIVLALMIGVGMRVYDRVRGSAVPALKASR